MTISNVVIHLSSQSSAAVAVDNVALQWVRGTRATATKKARVVEKLDHKPTEVEI